MGHSLTYRDDEGRTVTVTWQGEGAEAFATAARSVMLAATYQPSTVDDYIPDTWREWAYVEELRRDDSSDV